MKDPFVSLVVVSLNEEKTIGECLNSLNRIDYPIDRYEVIVVDGGSSDATVDLARKGGAKVLEGGNIPESRNMGMRAAKGEIVGYVDADSVMPAHWLKSAISHFRGEGVGCVGSRHRLPADATYFGRALMQHVSGKDWLPTRGSLYRKSALEEIGGFDEGLDTGEDWDLGVRLSKAGYQVVDDPELSFIHLSYPKTPVEYFRKKLWWSKKVVKVWAKHGFGRRQWNNIAYTLLYLGWPAAAAVSVMVYQGSPLIAACLLLYPLLPPAALSAQTAKRKGALKYMPALYLIYLLWGVAQAASIIRYNQVRYLAR